MFGCFRKKKERDNDIETGLKEEGGMKIEIYSASIRDARSIRFWYLLTIFFFCLLSLVVSFHSFKNNVDHLSQRAFRRGAVDRAATFQMDVVAGLHGFQQTRFVHFAMVAGHCG